MLRLVLIGLAIAPHIGASALSFNDLPTHPEASCATPAVRSAFTACAFSGFATAHCCSGLDAVFANSSSPSSGCLCYPQVLYKTLVRGSQSGLDILGLLNSCRKQHSSFHTQWAAAEPTACPAIPLSARAGEMIVLMGPEPILPSSKGRPAVAWSNMLQFGEVNQHMADISTVWEQLFGLHTVKLLLLVIINTAPLFLLMHSAVLTRFCPAYVQLAAGDQMIACQHAVYALVFSLSVIPQTVLAFTAMFKAWTGDYFASANLTALCGLFLASRAMLYLAEACVRSVVKRSWLLIVHHQLFFLIIVMGVWTQNTAVLGIGIVLDLFACHEAPLYVALLGYRLRWNVTFTRTVLRFACVWYIATRVFQTIVIMYMIAGFARMPAIRYAPEFVITSLLFGAFTIIQAYTLVIYHAIYRKVCGSSFVDDILCPKQLVVAGPGTPRTPRVCVEVAPA